MELNPPSAKTSLNSLFQSKAFTRFLSSTVRMTFASACGEISELPQRMFFSKLGSARSANSFNVWLRVSRFSPSKTFKRSDSFVTSTA